RGDDPTGAPAPAHRATDQGERPVTELSEQVANNIRMASEGETTVLKFKAGDRVRMPVTVMETDPHDREFPYRIAGPGGSCWWAKADDVEAAEANEAEPLAEWEKE